MRESHVKFSPIFLVELTKKSNVGQKKNQNQNCSKKKKEIKKWRVTSTNGVRESGVCSPRGT